MARARVVSFRSKRTRDKTYDDDEESRALFVPSTDIARLPRARPPISRPLPPRKGLPWRQGHPV